LHARDLPAIRIGRRNPAVRRCEAPKTGHRAPSDRSIGPVRGIRRASAVAGRLGRTGRRTDGLGSPSRRIGRESLGEGERGAVKG
jgi:hypothetical protein